MIWALFQALQNTSVEVAVNKWGKLPDVVSMPVISALQRLRQEKSQVWGQPELHRKTLFPKAKTQTKVKIKKKKNWIRKWKESGSQKWLFLSRRHFWVAEAEHRCLIASFQDGTHWFLSLASALCVIICHWVMVALWTRMLWESSMWLPACTMAPSWTTHSGRSQTP
jgi:hypothetical protein